MDPITLPLLLDVNKDLFLSCLDSLNVSPTVLGWRDPTIVWTGGSEGRPRLVLDAMIASTGGSEGRPPSCS